MCFINLKFIFEAPNFTDVSMKIWDANTPWQIILCLDKFDVEQIKYISGIDITEKLIN